MKEGISVGFTVGRVDGDMTGRVDGVFRGIRVGVFRQGSFWVVPMVEQ